MPLYGFVLRESNRSHIYVSRTLANDAEAFEQRFDFPLIKIIKESQNNLEVLWQSPMCKTPTVLKEESSDEEAAFWDIVKEIWKNNLGVSFIPPELLDLRDRAISQDDIVDLQIALNTTNDVNEFLELIA